MSYTTADAPLYDGKVPHLRCTKNEISEIVLLPGDPGRVNYIGSYLKNFKVISSNREFTMAKGEYKDCPITICSTGIGSPSAEIAVAELIKLGAKVLIRVGGCGALKENIECGDMIINTASVRLGGSSIFYARPEYPAVASFEVVSCLKEACDELNMAYHIGIGATVGSFYRGQGRNVLESNDPLNGSYSLLGELKKLNVLNFEMEAETIFTMCSIYDVMAGSICVVHCNRVTNKWLIEYDKPQKKLCLTALEGALKIYKKL